MSLDLSLSLGNAKVTPLQMADAYSMLANGGYKVGHNLIDRIEDAQGRVVWRQKFDGEPQLAANVRLSRQDALEPSWAGHPTVQQEISGGDLAQRLQRQKGSSQQTVAWTSPSGLDGVPVLGETSRVIPAKSHLDARIAYQISHILRDVLVRGTGAYARRLGRSDFSAKTGTTNDSLSTWFVGYNAELVTVAWVGFDDPTPLGEKEFGATTAMPIWMNFMESMAGVLPKRPVAQPAGLVTVLIDPGSGERAAAGDFGGIYEIFRKENAPSNSESASNVAKLQPEDIF